MTKPPTIGGRKYCNFGVANVAILVADAINTAHNLTGDAQVTVDDLVISKGYADKDILLLGLSLRIEDELQASCITHGLLIDMLITL